MKNQVRGTTAQGYLTPDLAAAVPSQLESMHGIITAPCDAAMLVRFLQGSAGSIEVSGPGSGYIGTGRLIVRPPTNGLPVGLFRSEYSMGAICAPRPIPASFLGEMEAVTSGKVSLWPGHPNWYEQVAESDGFFTHWIHTFVTEIALDGLLSRANAS